MMKKIDVVNATVQENLVGIRDVKAFVRGDFEEDKFYKVADDVKNAQVKAEKVLIFMMPLMQLVMYVSMIVVMWLGGKQVVFGTMKSGELISFFTYVTQVLSSLMFLGMIFMSIVMARACTERVLEVLDEQPDIKNPENPVMTVKDGSIDFENVSFSYSKDKSNCVLSDVSLKVESGQVVGIIGGTGSSKTTLVSLLPRLYDATSGNIKIGGVDVRDYDLEVLRDAVSVVLQKNVLFSGTIKENLRWGNKYATREECIRACKLACADSFIEKMPVKPQYNKAFVENDEFFLCQFSPNI